MAILNEKTGIILSRTKFYKILDIIATTGYSFSFFIIILSPGNLIVNIIICLFLQFFMNHVIWGSLSGIIIGNAIKNKLK